MSTALTKVSLWDRLRYGVAGTPLVVDGDPSREEDATIYKRKIILNRPPTVLSEDGHASAGVTKEMFKQYLVVVLERATGTEVDADIEFGDAVGRFVGVKAVMRQWGAEVEFPIPVDVITQEIASGLDLMMAGLALKANQAHRGQQDHTQANQLLDQAEKRFIALRNDSFPHFQDEAEYMHLAILCNRARRVTPLRTVAGTEKVLERHR